MFPRYNKGFEQLDNSLWSCIYILRNKKVCLHKPWVVKHKLTYKLQLSFFQSWCDWFPSGVFSNTTSVLRVQNLIFQNKAWECMIFKAWVKLKLLSRTLLNPAESFGGGLDKELNFTLIKGSAKCYISTLVFSVSPFYGPGF